MRRRGRWPRWWWLSFDPGHLRKRSVVTVPERVELTGSKSTRAGLAEEEKGVPVPSRTGTMCTTISSTSPRSRH